VKRLLTGECSLGIWFKSRIGSRGLGVWMDRICICDVVFVHFFCCRNLIAHSRGLEAVMGTEFTDKGRKIEWLV
jgi:hypothetical protein